MVLARCGRRQIRDADGRFGSAGRFTGHRRRGQVFEVVLALPVLLIATLAILQVGILCSVQQTVTTAAGDGVRNAASVGASAGSVVTEVLRDLSVNNVSDPADYFVRIEYGGSPPIDQGNASLLLSPPTGPDPLSAAQVRVTVCVRPTNSHNQPVPNWLSTLGCSLQNWNFQVSALAYRE